MIMPLFYTWQSKSKSGLRFDNSKSKSDLRLGYSKSKSDLRLASRQSAKNRDPWLILGLIPIINCHWINILEYAAPGQHGYPYNGFLYNFRRNHKIWNMLKIKFIFVNIRLKRLKTAQNDMKSSQFLPTDPLGVLTYTLVCPGVILQHPCINLQFPGKVAKK